MGKPVIAGVDVGSKECVVALQREGRAVQELRVANSPVGHQRLIRRLTRGAGPARVCLESTGIYGLQLALALHRTQGIQVMVANPRATHDFARALMQRSKTDLSDARVILEFVRRMPFAPWKPPAVEILQLRAISRRITGLKRSLNREKNRLHAAERCPELGAVVQQDIADHIEDLADRLERLGEQAHAMILAHPELKQRYDHLVSVRGIGQLSAIQILAELAVLPAGMTVRQWVAHAGLDPRHVESGTSVKKMARISRVGNVHLRRALYMPALVAIRYEQQIEAFYAMLLERGKKPMQAIVAVMRKLLHAIYGMFRNDQDFVGEKFFAKIS